MLINYITWDIRPEIFTIGNFAIRWYGMLFALSFITGYFIMDHFFRHEKVSKNLLEKLATYMVVATVIGARLGHCFFYEPGYYLSNPLRILKVWEGGLASHGAAIGILIALYIFSRKTKKPYIWILDRIVIVVALAGFFIRMGNLMNSEIYGIETMVPWGFIFILNNETLPKHPTQIYEGLFYLFTFLVLLRIYYSRYSLSKPGLILGLFFLMIFASRFLIEFIKEPQVQFENSMALNLGQILSIPFILFGFIITFVSLTGKFRKYIPGLK